MVSSWGEVVYTKILGDGVLLDLHKPDPVLSYKWLVLIPCSKQIRPVNQEKNNANQNSLKPILIQEEL